MPPSSDVEGKVSAVISGDDAAANDSCWAWIMNKRRSYWIDTWVMAAFELTMWTTAYASAITANKFIQIPIYRASLATQTEVHGAAAANRWSSMEAMWNATRNTTWDAADIEQTGWAKRPFEFVWPDGKKSGVWGWWKNASGTMTWVNASGPGGDEFLIEILKNEGGGKLFRPPSAWRDPG